MFALANAGFVALAGGVCAGAGLAPRGAAVVAVGSGARAICPRWHATVTRTKDRSKTDFE
jgi:hypothetical protein